MANDWHDNAFIAVWRDGCEIGLLEAGVDLDDIEDRVNQYAQRCWDEDTSEMIRPTAAMRRMALGFEAAYNPLIFPPLTVEAKRELEEREPNLIAVIWAEAGRHVARHIREAGE